MKLRWDFRRKRLTGEGFLSPKIQSGLALVENWSRRHTEYLLNGTIPHDRKLKVQNFIRFLRWYSGEEVHLDRDSSSEAQAKGV